MDLICLGCVVFVNLGIFAWVVAGRRRIISLKASRRRILSLKGTQAGLFPEDCKINSYPAEMHDKSNAKVKYKYRLVE